VTHFSTEYTAANEDEKNKFLMTLINLSLRQSRANHHRVAGGGADGGKISVINLPPEVQIVEDNDEGKKSVAEGDGPAWPIKAQGKHLVQSQIK
jgi:hypothetical protein